MFQFDGNYRENNEGLDAGGTEAGRINQVLAGQRLMDFVLGELESTTQSKPKSESSSISASNDKKISSSVGSGYPEILASTAAGSTTERGAELAIGHRRISVQSSEYVIGLPDGSAPLARLHYEKQGLKEYLALSTGAGELPYLVVERQVDDRGDGSYQIHYSQPDGEPLHTQNIEIVDGSLAAFDGSYSIPSADGSPVRWDVNCVLTADRDNNSGRVRDIQIRRSDSDETGFASTSGILQRMLSDAILQSIRTVAPWISRDDLFLQESDGVESSIDALHSNVDDWQDVLASMDGSSEDATASGTSGIEVASGEADVVADGNAYYEAVGADNNDVSDEVELVANSNYFSHEVELVADENDASADEFIHIDDDSVGAESYVAHIDDGEARNDSVASPSRTEFLSRFQSRSGFGPHRDEELSNLTPEQLNAALAYRVLNEPDKAAAAMSRLRLEAGRESNSSASEWYLNLSTLLGSERLNSASTPAERRSALLALGQLRLSHFNYLNPDDTVYRQLDGILRGRGKDGLAALVAAGRAHSMDASLAQQLISNSLNSEDASLRARSLATLTRVAENGHGGLIQTVSRLHDHVALRQLAESVRSPRPSSDALISSIRMLNQSSPEIQQRVLLAINAGLAAQADEPNSFSSLNDVLGYLEGGNPPSTEIRVTRAARFGATIARAAEEIRSDVAPVAGRSARELLTAGATGDQEHFNSMLERDLQIRRRAYEEFGNRERSFLSATASPQERQQHLEALRAFVTGQAENTGNQEVDALSALRDRSLPLDFADIEAVHGLARLHEAASPEEMTSALRGLEALSLNGNSRASSYIDIVLGSSANGAPRRDISNITEQTFQDLRRKLPALEGEFGQLRTRAATRALDLGAPNSHTLTQMRDSLRELAPASEAARRALSTVEVLIVAEELARNDSTAPSAERRHELMNQLRDMLDSEQHRPEARRVLFSIAEASGTQGHRAYVNDRFPPAPNTSNLPVNLSHLTTSEREDISSTALGTIERHLSSATVEPLSVREANILALLGGTTRNVDIGVMSSQMLSADIRSPRSSGAALEATINGLQVNGSNREFVGRLYLENVRTLPAHHFSTFQRWAANGDATSLQIMARVLSGLNPPGMEQRAQRTLLEYASTEQRQEQVTALLLDRQGTSQQCGMLLQTIGLLTSRGTNANPSEVRREALRVMRDALDASTRQGRTGTDTSTNANPLRAAVLDAYFANVRHWTPDDATLAARLSDSDALQRNATVLSGISADNSNFFLSELRYRAGSGGLREQVLYAQAVRALARFAQQQDVELVARLLRDSRGNGADNDRARRSLVDSLLACMGTSHSSVRDIAFDRFHAAGLGVGTGLDRETLDSMRRYATHASADAERMEQLATSNYALALQPPLTVVLARLGIRRNDLHDVASEMVRRAGGGEAAHKAVVEGLIGIELLAMMPAELRAGVIGATPLNSIPVEFSNDRQDAVARFVELMKSGSISAEQLEALRAVPARLGQQREFLLQDAARLATRLSEAATSRRRHFVDMFESITNESGAQFTARGADERAASRRVPELHDVEGIGGNMRTDNALQRVQRDSIAALRGFDRTLQQLRTEQTALMTRINGVEGLLRVAGHQQLLHSGQLESADILAMTAWTRNCPLTANYFVEQLQQGTGATGSSSALSRLHAAGIVTSDRLANPRTPQEAVDLYRSVRTGRRNGEPLPAAEQLMAGELRDFAMQSLLQSNDGQQLVAAMTAFGHIDFAQLVPSAATGRRTPELLQLIRENGEQVRTALAQLDGPRVERLRTALNNLASTGDAQARATSQSLLAFLEQTGPESRIRQMLRLMDDDQLAIPTWWEEFRGELIKISVLAVAAGVTVATCGKGAVVMLPLVSYVCTSATDEALLRSGIDPRSRGSQMYSILTGREHRALRADGSYTPVTAEETLREAGVSIGLDYAMMGFSRAAHLRGLSSANRAGLREVTLTSPQGARELITATTGVQRRHFLNQLGRNIGDNLGTSLAMTGIGHAGDAAGMSEVGAGMLYDFLRGALTRQTPPTAIRIHGDSMPVVRELASAGLLRIENDRFFLDTGRQRIPLRNGDGVALGTHNWGQTQARPPAHGPAAAPDVRLSIDNSPPAVNPVPADGAAPAAPAADAPPVVQPGAAPTGDAPPAFRPGATPAGDAPPARPGAAPAGDAPPARPGAAPAGDAPPARPGAAPAADTPPLARSGLTLNPAWRDFTATQLDTVRADLGARRTQLEAQLAEARRAGGAERSAEAWALQRQISSLTGEIVMNLRQRLNIQSTDRMNAARRSDSEPNNVTLREQVAAAQQLERTLTIALCLESNVMPETLPGSPYRIRDVGNPVVATDNLPLSIVQPIDAMPLRVDAALAILDEIPRSRNTPESLSLYTSNQERGFYTWSSMDIDLEVIRRPWRNGADFGGRAAAHNYNHEVGHHLQEQYFDTLPNSTRLEVRDAYRAALLNTESGRNLHNNFPGLFNHLMTGMYSDNHIFYNHCFPEMFAEMHALYRLSRQVQGNPSYADLLQMRTALYQPERFAAMQGCEALYNALRTRVFEPFDALPAGRRNGTSPARTGAPSSLGPRLFTDTPLGNR